jgi:hypothetical protein
VQTSQVWCSGEMGLVHPCAEFLVHVVEGAAESLERSGTILPKPGPLGIKRYIAAQLIVARFRAVRDVQFPSGSSNSFPPLGIVFNLRAQLELFSYVMETKRSGFGRTAAIPSNRPRARSASDYSRLIPVSMLIGRSGGKGVGMKAV